SSGNRAPERAKLRWPPKSGVSPTERSWIAIRKPRSKVRRGLDHGTRGYPDVAPGRVCPWMTRGIPRKTAHVAESPPFPALDVDGPCRCRNDRRRRRIHEASTGRVPATSLFPRP